MKRGMLPASILLAIAILVANAGTEVSPPNVTAGETSDERIRFQITAVEVGAAGRKVISDAAVEGPPGTDFNVNLQDDRFRMSAKFLTDLAPGGGLTLRGRLETRRLYGKSEVGLPLYEEDTQRHTLRLGFDEAVVLLPFGGGGDDGEGLRIEIKPARVGRRTSGDFNTPEITINKPSPGGAIYVEASKVPHDFVVEATLLEDGREVARGIADSLLGEPGELLLRPNGAAGEGAAVPLALNLTVERYEPGAGAGRAAVRFDVFGDDPQRASTRTALARNWAGVAALGSDLIYDLSQTYRGVPGKKYELKLRVNLASADKAGRRD